MGWAFWRRAAQNPGAAPSKRRSGSSEDGEGRSDLAVALRTRARRRLIGAAALLLAVAIVLPMVLDEDPRPVADTIQIDIPSDRTPFASRLALPPSPEAGNVQTSPPPDASAAEKRAEAAPTTQKEARSGLAIDNSEPKSPAKSAAAPLTNLSDRAAEEKRARDILEGKAADATKGASAAKTGRFVLQAAALGNESAARELSERLQKAGFAPYTERTETKEGVRYRVRLGPFATRDEAERTRARLRALGIDASVVTS